MIGQELACLRSRIWHSGLGGAGDEDEIEDDVWLEVTGQEAQSDEEM